ncbi:MarR family transcriptional regulator, partial [Candidatus Pelagibacter communis]|uniref:MarR family transcriptional regulator n=1 Tax=Pelagibacter ubique TaxID=198252 RepID=UPI00094D423A
YQLGTAHHKSLHLISFYEGITISQLLKKLNVTKQSLNRVLNDLKKLEFLEFKKGNKDTRVRHIYLSPKGNKIYNEIFFSQKKRIYKAFLNSSAKEVLNFDLVLKRIMNEKL